jgi:hypothetical protein
VIDQRFAARNVVDIILEDTRVEVVGVLHLLKQRRVQ